MSLATHENIPLCVLFERAFLTIIYARLCMCAYVCTPMSVRVCICVCMHLCVCVHVCLSACAYVLMSVHPCMSVFMCACRRVLSQVCKPISYFLSERRHQLIYSCLLYIYIYIFDCGLLFVL